MSQDKKSWQPDDWQRLFGRDPEPVRPEREDRGRGEEAAEEESEQNGSRNRGAQNDWASRAKEVWEARSSQDKEAKKGGESVSGRRGGKKGVIGVLGLVIAALVLFLVAASLYTVPEGEYAYLTQFGKIVAIIETPGLHLHMPFVQSANRITSKIMIYDVSPSEVLTADKKAMIVDSYALWKIEDVTRFIRTVGNIPELQKRLDASVYSNIKNIMGRLQQNEIISDEEGSRDSLNERITEEVMREMAGYGVAVKRVEIRRYDLPSDNLSAVYSRMISERRQMAASYKANGEYEAAKIRNNTDKECEIMIGEALADSEKMLGEGEKEYMQILQELYGDKDKSEFFVFMMELEALQKSLKGDKTLILGPESPLTRIFTDRSQTAEKP